MSHSRAPQTLKFSERVSYCAPLRESTDGRKPNDAPDVLWKIFKRNKAIFGELANYWYMVFPDGNYMPEDSNDTHLMISPKIDGEFSSIQTLDRASLNPIADMLLRFIKSAGPEGLAGYNVGTDFTRLTPQSWANLHIHLIERGELDYQSVENRSSLPKKLREPASQHITSAAEFVLKKYGGTGMGRLVKPSEGIFNGFPVAGAIVELQPGVSGQELVNMFQHIDIFYSTLHRQIFTSFVDNYDSAQTSHGVVPFNLRGSDEIVQRLQLFNEEVNMDGELNSVVKFLIKLAKSVRNPNLASVLKNWGEYEATKDKNRHTIDNKLKILAPPSYSIAMAHRKGKSYLVLGIHILSEAGAQDILGTLTPRVYRNGESFTKRRLRGRALSKKIDSLFSGKTETLDQ